jgi:hypothetical protein
VNLASGHFYDTTAFATAAAITLGLITIAVTVWVTFRAASQKRRLYYALLTDTPLIRRRQDLSEELKVTYGGRELNSPHVVSVQLVSRSRRDIAREAFDEGKPLCPDLGTPIVECVKVTTSPSDRPDPACAIDGTKLLIGPSHFGTRQTTVFSLLVDGKSPRITRPPQSLIDVHLESGDPQARFNIRWNKANAWQFVGAIVGLFALIVALTTFLSTLFHRP